MFSTKDSLIPSAFLRSFPVTIEVLSFLQAFTISCCNHGRCTIFTCCSSSSLCISVVRCTSCRRSELAGTTVLTFLNSGSHRRSTNCTQDVVQFAKKIRCGMSLPALHPAILILITFYRWPSFFTNGSLRASGLKSITKTCTLALRTWEHLFDAQTAPTHVQHRTPVFSRQLSFSLRLSHSPCPVTLSVSSSTA